MSIRGRDAARRYIYVWLYASCASQVNGQLRLHWIAGRNARQTFQWNVGMVSLLITWLDMRSDELSSQP